MTRELIANLRKAADLLEQLFNAVNNTELIPLGVEDKPRKKYKKTATKKVHWTQRPENAKKVSEMAKQSAKTRKNGKE